MSDPYQDYNRLIKIDQADVKAVQAVTGKGLNEAVRDVRNGTLLRELNEIIEYPQDPTTDNRRLATILKLVIEEWI